jgi:enamine deaminase RidA (YjgF/YER057c/UK114 family)
MLNKFTKNPSAREGEKIGNEAIVIPDYSANRVGLIVEAANQSWITGMIPVRLVAGAPVLQGSIEDQTTQTHANLRKVLEAAEYTDDIDAEMTVFLGNEADKTRVLEVLNKLKGPNDQIKFAEGEFAIPGKPGANVEIFASILKRGTAPVPTIESNSLEFGRPEGTNLKEQTASVFKRIADDLERKGSSWAKVTSLEVQVAGPDAADMSATFKGLLPEGESVARATVQNKKGFPSAPGTLVAFRVTALQKENAVA